MADRENETNPKFHGGHEFSRRDFLALGAAVAASAGLSP